MSKIYLIAEIGINHNGDILNKRRDGFMPRHDIIAHASIED